MKVYGVFEQWVKTTFDADLYDYQIAIANRVLKAYLYDRRRGPAPELGIEVSRQAGKTTGVVYVVAFLMTWFPKTRIGIFAPQREQAKTNFDRLKVLLKKLTQVTGEFNPDESNANTLRLENESECYIFPVTPTSHPESKSLDLIIAEEAQSLNDHEFMNDVRPMGASTNAPVIFIGSAGYSLCYFYRLLQRNDELIYDCKKVFEHRQRLYEKTGNPEHLRYKTFVEEEERRLGTDSDEFRAPYLLKWILGGGQFCTGEDLDRLIMGHSRIYQEGKRECYAGIDTAKNPDSTVVTILRELPEPRKIKLTINGREVETEVRKELVNWLELRGDNYKDQFDIISNFLGNYNVRAVAIDATGQGDFMPDMFERETEWRDEKSGLYRVKFSAVSKDVIYKNLEQSIKNLLTAIPKLETKEGVRFREQMLDLQKEWKGQLLSCHHPNSPDAHDDYCDSWALAEYAFMMDRQTLDLDIRGV